MDLLKYFSLLSFVTIFSIVLFKSPVFAGEQCSKPRSHSSQTQISLSSNWSTYSSIKALEKDFWKLYQGDQRLQNRVYLERGEYYYDQTRSKITIPVKVINSITHHIEEALRLQYGEYLFYPDLGHVHLYLPETEFKGLDDEEILNHPDLVFLYHSAELFQFKEDFLLSNPLVNDDWFRWRYYTRNFLGELYPQKRIDVIYSNNKFFNTVRSLAGYKMVDTLYFSSHKKGCFPYQLKNRTLYFDLSFSKKLRSEQNNH